MNLAQLSSALIALDSRDGTNIVCAKTFCGIEDGHARTTSTIQMTRCPPRQGRIVGQTDRVNARMVSDLGNRLHPPLTEPLSATWYASMRWRRAAGSLWNCESRRSPACHKLCMIKSG
jgi:hypothetical protein